MQTTICFSSFATLDFSMFQAACLASSSERFRSRSISSDLIILLRYFWSTSCLVCKSSSAIRSRRVFARRL